jgi:hypothetical protein
VEKAQGKGDNNGMHFALAEGIGEEAVRTAGDILQHRPFPFDKLFQRRKPSTPASFSNDTGENDAEQVYQSIPFRNQRRKTLQYKREAIYAKLRQIRILGDEGICRLPGEPQPGTGF